MRNIVIILPLLLLFFISDDSFARYRPASKKQPTKKQIENYVREAISFVKIYGKQEALKEFNLKDGLFTRGELYIFAYDYKCNVLAHPIYPKWVGRDFSELADPTGRKIIKDMVKIVKTRGKGWINYRWFHPVSRDIQQKIGFVHKIDKKWWIGAGRYIKK